jgi:hypothetical protein
MKTGVGKFQSEAEVEFRNSTIQYNVLGGGGQLPNEGHTFRLAEVAGCGRSCAANWHTTAVAPKVPTVAPSGQNQPLLHSKLSEKEYEVRPCLRPITRALRPVIIAGMW